MRRAVGQCPFLHGVRDRVDDLRVERLEAVDRAPQLGVDRLCQVLALDDVAEDVLAVDLLAGVLEVVLRGADAMVGDGADRCLAGGHALPALPSLTRLAPAVAVARRVGQWPLCVAACSASSTTIADYPSLTACARQIWRRTGVSSLLPADSRLTVAIDVRDGYARSRYWGGSVGGMVVIFGFGDGRSKDLGEVAPATCPNCHNDVFLHEVQSEQQFSLYFVPLSSYNRNEYLLCPICHSASTFGPKTRPR